MPGRDVKADYDWQRSFTLMHQKGIEQNPKVAVDQTSAALYTLFHLDELYERARLGYSFLSLTEY
jgi:hypothetical protein